MRGREGREKKGVDSKRMKESGRRKGGERGGKAMGRGGKNKRKIYRRRPGRWRCNKMRRVWGGEWGRGGVGGK